jgi:hypothetical protein
MTATGHQIIATMRQAAQALPHWLFQCQVTHRDFLIFLKPTTSSPWHLQDL